VGWILCQTWRVLARQPLDSSRRRRATGPACLLLGTAALALSACGEPPARPYGPHGSLELRIVSPFPRQSILAAGTRFFEEELTALLPGTLRIDSYYGGSLVTPEETLTAIGHGVADAGTGLWIYSPGRLPLGAFEYHFFFNDPDSRTQAWIKRRLFERVPALDAELAAENVAPPLVFGPLSPYLILSREPLKDLADLQGKRIGFTPVEYVPVFRAVGAVPVLSPASEFYERLSLGVVDGVAVSVEILYLFRLYELAPHLLDIAFNTPTPLSIWVNLGYWNALSAEDRERFAEAGRRAEQRYLDLLAEEVLRARAGLRAAGVRFSRLSDAAIHEWRSRISPIARLWAERMDGRNLPGSQVVQAYAALSAEAGWPLDVEIEP
jgi:TRAP-type C4-dicarboxylate transport system substrate-binding protein